MPARVSPGSPIRLQAAPPPLLPPPPVVSSSAAAAISPATFHSWKGQGSPPRPLASVAPSTAIQGPPSSSTSASRRPSDAVANFNQIQVGDELDVVLVDQLAVHLVAGGAPPSVGEAAGVALAPLGAKPGAVVADKAKTPPEQKNALPAIPRGGIAAEQLPPQPGVKQAEAPATSRAPARVASADDRVELPASEGEAEVKQLVVKPSAIFVQAGAFSRADNANRLRAKLSWIGPSKVSNVFVAGQEIFRVRIGPLPSVSEADSVLRQVFDEGIMDAHIIVN